MAKDPFDVALAGFRRWMTTKPGGDPEVAAGEMSSLLDPMRDYLGIDRPADLGGGGLKEKLLRVYPWKVTVLDRADSEDTIPAVRDFLAYLAERGEMPASKARALARELDRIAPRFTDAVMDPSNWGMARSLVQAIAVDDQAAVDRWIAGYNSRLAWPGGEEEYEDDDQDFDLKEALGLPDQMPPMRLPAAPELAALARHVPLIAQLRRLAGWLGAGRVVTEDAELARDDAAEAAAELSVDVPRLEYLWPLALDAEFVELDEDETRAFPGEIAQAWDEGDDDEVLDIWEMVFALVIDTTLDVAAALDPSGSSEELDFFGHGALLAVMLFL